MATRKMTDKEKRKAAGAAGKVAAGAKPSVKKVSASKDVKGKFYDAKTGKPAREPGD